MAEHFLPPPQGNVPAVRVSGLSRRQTSASPHDGDVGFRLRRVCLGRCRAAAASIIIVTRGVAATPSLLAWAALISLGVGLTAGVWKFIRNNSGRFDLCAAPSSRLTLPANAGRREPLSLAWADLSGVTVQRRSSKIPSGMYYSYVPALAVAAAGGLTRAVPLVTWGWDEERALAFGHWLSDKLNARFIGVEDEADPRRTV